MPLHAVCVGKPTTVAAIAGRLRRWMRQDALATIRRTTTRSVTTASASCRICGEPLAAVLADWGSHLLCLPRTAHATTSKAAA